VVKTLYWQPAQHMLNFIFVLYIALYKFTIDIDIDSSECLNSLTMT